MKKLVALHGFNSFLFRYTPVKPAESDDDVITCWENTTLFLTSAYQYIILAFVLNKGYPHRKPFFKNCKNRSVVRRFEQ